MLGKWCRPFFAVLKRLTWSGFFSSRSHFWMALLEGKKRWLMYPKEQAPLLHPIWPEGCHDPVFEADMETPDADRTPGAFLATGYEGVLEAGATCVALLSLRVAGVLPASCVEARIGTKYIIL